MLSNSWGIDMGIEYRTLSKIEASERLTRLFCELANEKRTLDVNRQNSTSVPLKLLQ